MPPTLALVVVWIAAATLCQHFLHAILAPSASSVAAVTVAQLMVAALATLPLGGRAAIQAALRPSAALLAAAALHTVGTVLTNASSAAGSLSASQIVKSLEPATAAALGWAVSGAQFSRHALAWALVLSAAAALACTTGLAVTPAGVALALGANVANVSRNIVTKTCLPLGRGDGSVAATFAALSLVAAAGSAALLAVSAVITGDQAGHLATAATVTSNGYADIAGVALSFAVYQFASLAILARVAPLAHASLSLAKRAPALLWSMVLEREAGTSIAATVGPVATPLIVAGVAFYQVAVARHIHSDANKLTTVNNDSDTSGGERQAVTPSEGRNAISIVNAGVVGSRRAVPAHPSAYAPAGTSWVLSAAVAALAAYAATRGAAALPGAVGGAASRSRSSDNDSPILAVRAASRSRPRDSPALVAGATVSAPGAVSAANRVNTYGGVRASPVRRWDPLAVTSLTIVRAAVTEFGCAERCAVESLLRLFEAGADVAPVDARLLTAAPTPVLPPPDDGRWPAAAPLQVQAVLADTPLHVWALDHVRWKIVSGPLFPRQLEYALALAVLWARGGAVAATDAIFAPQGGAARLHLRHCSVVAPDLVALAGQDGGAPDPALLAAPPQSPLVWRAMQHLHATLVACSRDQVASCGFTPDTAFADFVAGEGPVFADRACTYHAVVERGHGACSAQEEGTLEQPTAGAPAAMTAVSFASCDALSSGGVVHPLSRLAAALAQLRGGVCHRCAVLPQWSGGRRQVYGVLTYDTANIGDETQSGAALGFLPHIDVYVGRDSFDVMPHHLLTAGRGRPAENLSLPLAEHQVTFLANGWWKWWHDAKGSTIKSAPSLPTSQWPVPAHWRPFAVSMHFNSAAMPPPQLALLAPLNGVGARDQHSAAALAAAGVPSFFSGCLTLTMRRPHYAPSSAAARKGYIVSKMAQPANTALLRAVVPAAILAKATEMSQSVKQRGTTAGHRDPVPRQLVAERYLQAFASAKLVVTDRLHVALPSIAMGTPVLFVAPATFMADERFGGLLDSGGITVVTTADAPELRDFDWDNPPAPPADGGVLLHTVRQQIYSLLLQDPVLARSGFMFDMFRLQDGPGQPVHGPGLAPRVDHEAATDNASHDGDGEGEADDASSAG
jgi:hypothetical protein